MSARYSKMLFMTVTCALVCQLLCNVVVVSQSIENNVSFFQM